jgi:hypothetical protein
MEVVPAYQKNFFSSTQEDIFKNEILTKLEYQDIARLCRTCKGLYFNESLQEEYLSTLTAYLQDGGKLSIPRKFTPIEQAAELFIEMDDGYESIPGLNSCRNFLWKVALVGVFAGAMTLASESLADDPTNIQIAGGLTMGLSLLLLCGTAMGRLFQPFRGIAKQLASNSNELAIPITDVDELMKHRERFALPKQIAASATPTEKSALLARSPARGARGVEDGDVLITPATRTDLDPLFPNEMTILEDGLHF